ncbi:hypothetical protein J2T60_001224 [Natronospira proteinivora]|uniref:ParB/Sulfiredoxin domain-containing protein n=1 Tax=Natronospira proteinivora TaxID=1807133 RepID=A0ABT1G7H5_9GAMM|nr:ParB/Srx family N-terminal domain-containing protein [Natronospira proteinivora]MCP1727259.1 hypothetical protein [Natronospira proteinivora]
MDEANPNNSHFYRKTIRIADLELDPENPRISLRPGEDERRCIERLAHTEGPALLALCRDIAENGLGIDPIVVSRDNDQWLVRDGNRRVTALKLLNNPDQSPPELATQVRRARDSITEIPKEIQCDISENEDAIIEHISRQHRGAGSGEGLRQWEAVERALFELRYDLRSQDALSAKVLRYASEHELTAIPSNFPITTLTRFLTRERLAKIGFKNIDSHPPVLNQSRDTVHQRIRKIISDLSTGRVNVTRNTDSDSDSFSMMHTQDQTKYLEELLSIGSPELSGQTEDPETLDNPQQRTDKTGAEDSSNSHSNTDTGSNKPPTGTRKSSWERNHITKPIRHYGLPEIPREHQKARDVQAELTKINLKHTPMAAAVLVRLLIELTVEHYVQTNNLGGAAKKEAGNGKVGLGHRLIASAKHMNKNNILDREKTDLTIQQANKEQMSLHTLNKVVHSEYFFEGKESLNKFWDNLRPFLRECWKASA